MYGLAGCSGIVLFFIVGFLGVESSEALSSIGVSRFFTDANWYPHEQASEGSFNLIPLIVGTLVVTAGASIIAAPTSIATAIYLHLYAPAWVQKILRAFIEVLTGIPSVVYGLWGLVTVVPLINTLAPPGASLLAGGIILGMMIWPTITLACENAIGAVPMSERRGALALGLSRSMVLRTTILPSVRHAFGTALLLGVGRALGETMAVLMVCGNIIQIPSSIFSPIRTLTSNIALEMGYAMGDHRSALFAMGLLLTGIVGCIVMFSHRVFKEGDAGRVR